MKLFTKVEIGEIPLKIQLSHRILTLGSCFAENIGSRFLTNKFHVTCNPFGIIYNPTSISKSIKRLVKATSIKEDELQLCQNYYCHMDFHSKLNRLDKQATILGINNAIYSSHAFANEGIDWLIISLGTANVYVFNETNEIVSNCHKIPASQFKKRLLSTTEIVDALNESVSLLKSLNPSLKTIITVSPIRHTKDGLQPNARSKARLIDAANEMTTLYEDCYYYPSYEIMTDELRDYRWYEADLIHPNQQAINYIWERFKRFALSEKSINMIKQIEALNKNLDHRPFLIASPQYLEFLRSTTNQLENLNLQNPTLDFSEEFKRLESLKQAALS